MNFKTTIVLIVLLAVAGIAILFTRERGQSNDATDAKQAQKIFDVADTDVNKISIAPADGKKLVLEKAAAGKWRLSEPVNAPAEAFEVDNLLKALTALESHGAVDTSTADAKSTGLATPRFTVDISTTAGKTTTLLVGDKLAVGDNLYVSRKDKGDTAVVGTDILEKLEKPASDYRDKKLVTDYSTAGIGQIILNRPDGKLVLERSGTDQWKITEPTPMPAEKSEVDDIIFGLTGLRAVEFVGEDATDAALYQLDQPRITATLSAPPPTTRPTPFVTSAPTSQPAPVIIKFGRYDDVLKKNVMVMTSQSPAIAKVASTVMDTISKKPLDLRDRKVLDLDPQQASSITIVSDLSATTRPTSRPASTKEVVLKRRKESATTAPASQATSNPTTTATTTPTTKPATAVAAATAPATQPTSKWQVVSTTQRSPADDVKIDTLLSQLHPLRAKKYLEKSPATQPTASYTLHITTEGPGGTPVNQYELKFVDPGNSGDVIGTYNGLTFEVDRFLLDRFSGDFLKSSAQPAAAAPQGFPNEAAPETTGP